MSTQHVTAEFDGRVITNWEGFHDAFSSAFGFPAWYGRNMDAWIDLMTMVDDPDDPTIERHVAPGDTAVIQITNYQHFKKHAPEVWLALLECAAFVNWRRIENGESAVIALSFHE